VVTLDAWESVPPGNETALMQAVSQHPVAVGMCCGDYLDVRSIATSISFAVINTAWTADQLSCTSIRSLPHLNQTRATLGV